MLYWAKFTAVLAACLSIAGCLGLRQQVQLPAADREDRPGTVVHVVWGQVRSEAGCPLAYVWYRPSVRSSQALVVLAHGFLRRKERLADLAQTFAAAGIETVAVDLCNMRLWSGNHARNGFDLIRVADHLQARQVIYAGFSAGGLAALVAARNDRRTIGVLTLDLVDAQGLGQLMVGGFERPIIGLFGEPSACNAHNNGLITLAAAHKSQSERIPEAGHCDFESPTDWLCRALCEEDAQGAERRRTEILMQALAAIQALVESGADRLQLALSHPGQ
ncbi:alpha/beta hydrolase [Caldichromatium japonicum]|uniref:Alpha/beta hydrolase n=1 Tax=Caldichromatium japonicum TaxID=2699430 RepID=A0A6G7VD31_9GAMM|nr:alpha/beta hydrolase [Caldichromatium japonicum]QIK37697.1 alpha/beta hydrolase [Caldichromatium japonicum]